MPGTKKLAVKKKITGKYTPDQLFDYIMEETSSEICCSRCGLSNYQPYDADMAQKDFFDEGWRATKQNVYCPDCANKKLK